MPITKREVDRPFAHYWALDLAHRVGLASGFLFHPSARLLVLIYSQPGRQKLRNISKNSRVDLNLNSNAHGCDVVRLEGIADVVEDAPPATEVPEYVEKYRDAIARIGFDPDGFARAYSVAIRVMPARWQVW